MPVTITAVFMGAFPLYVKKESLCDVSLHFRQCVDTALTFPPNFLGETTNLK